MSTRHTALIALQAAENAYYAAQEACPHWNYESEGRRLACCMDALESRRNLNDARRAYNKQEYGW